MCTISREIQFYHHLVSLACAIKIPALLTKTRMVLFLKTETADFPYLTIQEIKPVDYYMYLGHSLKYF